MRELIQHRNNFDKLFEICEGYKTSKIKKMLDSLQRQVYLAEQFSGSDYICPLTGDRFRSHDSVDVCHYIDRGNMSTRWDDENCVLCSRFSNRVDSNVPSTTSRSKHHEDFERYLGEDTVERLKIDSKNVVNLCRTDYVVILQSYLKRLHG